MEQAMQQQQVPTDPRLAFLATPPPQAAPQAAPAVGTPSRSLAEKIASAADNDDLFSDDSDDEVDNDAVRKPEPSAGELNGEGGAATATATATASTLPQAAAPAPAVTSTGAPTSLPQDVVHIQEVEWATPEDLEPGRYTEKAARPPLDRTSDPCGCFPDGTGAPCCLDMSCVLFACQEECRSNCEAGSLCGNKRIQRREWKELQVFDAGPKGRGLRTLEPVKSGDFISEYVGVAIKKKHLDSLFRRYQSERMLYIMALDNDVYIDARKRGGIARYINHSCEPNCMVDRWKVRGVLRACVFALRDIEAGEELTFDYKWTRKRGRAPTKCYCGTPSCRGTLELPKESSLEDEELEMMLSGHWKTPANPSPGVEIINRVIKVYFDGDHEYYAADVCQYDQSTGKHQIIYKSDLSDAWEDLSKLQWMILDEEMQQFIIAKKSATGSIRPSSAASDGQQQTMAKNYIMVQDSVKEVLDARNVIKKCELHCRVKVNVVECDRSGLDEAEKAAIAKQGSNDDAVCWKLVVTGINPVKARTYLQHNVEDILRKASVQAAKDAEQESKSAFSAQKEIVIPRCVTDSVKRNLHQIRTNCRNVDVTFTHSDSKSKQFAKLVLGANVSADLERAQDVVWKELFKLCAAAMAPLTPSGVFKDLGILGGELSSDEFKLLFEDASGRSLNQECSENLRESAFFSNFEDIHRCTIWVQSEGDMGRIDSNNRVVNEADPKVPRKIFFGAQPSRVRELWTLIRSRATDLMRGVKFLNLGADKVYLKVLTDGLQRKGQTKVDYFFDYVQRTTGASVRVDNLTNNHLRIDGGDKTKEKCEDGENGKSEVDRRIAFAEELIHLQIELLRDHYIRKQRWGFGRDWTLLMDADPAVTKKEAVPTPTRSLSPTPGAYSAARNRSDPRAVAGACMDIADITSSLDLDRAVAAHSCIILYRFLNQLAGASSSTSQLKLREVSLACLFLANKAQKVHKWKRLEDVLEAAYLTFYAGAKFDEKSEEATNWEKRVLAAEREVLTTLEYDVFWPGVDWIVTAVVESGKVAEPMAENAMELALSGPVLAAGPNLWLKFGPEYAFAAMAGLLSINMDSLFSSLPLMPIKVSQTAELIAKSVQQNSAKKYTSKKSLKPSHAQLFHGGQMSLLNNVPHVQQACNFRMSSGTPSKQSKDTATSSAWERDHTVIAHRSRRSRIVKDVSLALVKECILPVIDGICAESRCSVFFEEGSKEGTENIILEGSWRAISIAEHLLKCAVTSPPATDVPGQGYLPTTDVERPNETTASQEKMQPNGSNAAAVSQSASSLASTAASIEQDLPPSVELADTNVGLEKMQAKLKPGVIKMSDIDMSDGWEGTVEPSSLEPGSQEKQQQHKIGGKTCLPGVASEASFKEAGLRWWIPPRYGPSRTGSLCDILAIRKAMSSDSTAHSEELAKLAMSLEAHSGDGTSPFTVLKSHLSGEVAESVGKDRSVAMSLQRWPPEKVEIKEKSKSKSAMQVGFSPTALQEMQLLQQLHFLIPAPQGHPNFALPVAVAMDSKPAETEVVATKSAVSASSSSDEIFSLLNMIEQKPIEEKKKKKGTSGSHLVFQPTPLVLQKVISRTKKRSSRDTAQQPEVRVVTPTILASWFHDLLSALSMCHSNHIILRTINPDQILIDYSGVAMLSCLSRSVVLHAEDRGRFIDPVRSARQQKRGGSGDSSDDVSNDPYMAPELLLGSTKCTKETDIFSLGCLMAQLLLNKPLFSGRDRTTKARAIFKVVGIPSSENYPQGVKFPSYEDIKPPKKYKRGVEKALRYMMKDSGIDIDAYSLALQLLDAMLHLDPKKRITAADALKHDFMTQHVDSIKSDEYRQEFVNDWMVLRDSVILDKDVKKVDKSTRYAGIGLVKVKTEVAPQDKETKRKALLMEAARGDGDDDDDDLYNMDDILGVEPASKKAKTGP